MNWRPTFLAGILAAGALLVAAPQAEAKHRHSANCVHRTGYDSYGGQCGEIARRISYDRAKLRELSPNRKSARWYQEDLKNAYRDLDRCRYGDVAYDDRYDPPYRGDAYDPYAGAYGGYDDPYYGANVDGSFDWKRDWPMLLGVFLNQQR